VVMVETVIVPGMSAMAAIFLSSSFWADRTEISPAGEEPQLGFQVAGVDVGDAARRHSYGCEVTTRRLPRSNP
jgi:hypothetical protein